MGGVDGALAELTGCPPLLLPGECDRLRARLAAVARGEAFLLAADDVAGGQVAEAFGTLLRMAVVLSYAGARPVVKVVGPLGDGAPARETYQATAAALNLLRGLTAGHHTDVRRVHGEIQDFVARSPARARHTRLTRRIAVAIRFMEACGATPEALRRAEFFTGHEARDMAYERALTRTAERGGRYGLSGHLLWLDGRTRRPDGPQVSYAAGIRNPLGVRLGPATTADEVPALIDRLDPGREPGRLTFLVRMGATAVRDRLPGLVAKATASGAPVGWVCDPVPDGTPARVLDEIGGFFEVLRGLGGHPGGVRLELAGSRLGPEQALDLAFALAELY
ncbi:3-deoxy-7-phosphoheptulonate synthase [Streptomyces sp. NPDC001606]